MLAHDMSIPALWQDQLPEPRIQGDTTRGTALKSRKSNRWHPAASTRQAHQTAPQRFGEVTGHAIPEAVFTVTPSREA